MRPPNFLSTTSNRASLSITQTLYDRRALDCTASRPLIQSLHQLLLLTGSSVRVRETLCIDGGLERLVQIMKESSRSDDKLAGYKWHLCIQCLLNLGTRGSENVRQRILEAGAIPVVATVLDNYLVANETAMVLRNRECSAAKQTVRPNAQAVTPVTSVPPVPPVPAGAQVSTSSLSESDSNTAESETRENLISNEGQQQPAVPAVPVPAVQQQPTPTAQPTPTVQPTQPAQQVQTTPGLTPTPMIRTATPNAMQSGGQVPRDFEGVYIHSDQDVLWALEIIAFVSKYSHLRREMQETHLLPQLSVRPRHEVYECGHTPVRSVPETCTDDGCDEEEEEEELEELEEPVDMEVELLVPEIEDGELLDPNTREIRQFMERKLDVVQFPESTTHLDTQLAEGPLAPALGEQLAQNISLSQLIPLELVEPNALQRQYFHYSFESGDYDEEHLARRFNLFELVEHFTKLRGLREFPYWACIIMRNFVRKDEVGIRQCANFACGKWEKSPREFAKCRRCKRTKYCCKDCQLKSWSTHRYWCAPSQSSSSQQSQEEH